MHILIIRFSSMGDVIIQTPLVSWLKSQVPGLKITFLTSREYGSLVNQNESIDNVLLYSRSKGSADIKQIYALTRHISNELKPDFIIDLHNTLRAKLIKILCPAVPSITIDKRSLRRTIFIKLKVNLFKNLENHHQRVIQDFKSFFHLKYSRDELEKYVSSQGANKSSSRITSIGQLPTQKSDYIVISPIASFSAKRWPIIQFKQLIELILNDPDLLGFDIKIVAGPNDEYCQQLDSDLIRESKRFLNLQGLTSLSESNDILSKASLCVTNDTGAGHISEAYGVPVIAIFGPTSEYFGFSPHLRESFVLSATDVWCRPCSADGKKKCYRSEPFCMTNIKPESVLELVKKSLLLKDTNV